MQITEQHKIKRKFIKGKKRQVINKGIIILTATSHEQQHSPKDNEAKGLQVAKGKELPATL